MAYGISLIWFDFVLVCLAFASFIPKTSPGSVLGYANWCVICSISSNDKKRLVRGSGFRQTIGGFY